MKPNGMTLLGTMEPNPQESNPFRELRYVYSFRGEYRFSSMSFKAWLLRRGY